MSATWIHFTPHHVPPKRRLVLVQIAGSDDGYPPAVAVGYVRHFSDEHRTPYFVVPGFGRPFSVTHWSDCLGDDFSAPLWWEGMQKRSIEEERPW